MEFLKKHGMKIIISILVVMFFGTCANNCSNKNKLREYAKTATVSDSVICVMTDSISKLNMQIKDLNTELQNTKEVIGLLNKSNSDLNKALNRNVVVNIKQESNEEK